MLQPLGRVVGLARVERLDRHERGDQLAEQSWVENCPITLDDTALLQPADPLLRGGRGQAGLLADVGVGHPAVAGKKRKNAAVQGFHGRIVPG